MTTKTKSRAKCEALKGQTIKLSRTVVVSDPCYKIPTWCQAVVKNVKAGKYHTSIIKRDMDDWGVRTANLIVIHEGYSGAELNWEHHPGTIGVDSGQCGIFSSESYRNDEIGESIPFIKDKSPFDTLFTFDEEGDNWYHKMCDMTLTPEDGFGTYSEGIVSRCGLGDGSYDLYVARSGDKIVGFMLDFGLHGRKTILSLMKLVK